MGSESQCLSPSRPSPQNEGCAIKSKMWWFLHMSRAKRKCVMSYANNKAADQPAHPLNLISAFVVCCLDSISLRLYSRNFKILASFCGCAGRFVSGLVGNSRRHVLSCRGSYICCLHISEWTEISKTATRNQRPYGRDILRQIWPKLVLAKNWLDVSIAPQKLEKKSFVWHDELMFNNHSVPKKNFKASDHILEWRLLAHVTRTIGTQFLFPIP